MRIVVFSILCLYVLLVLHVRQIIAVMLMYVVISGHMLFVLFFFFKRKTAYEMRISDWSSDVCSSDRCRPCQNAVCSERLIGSMHGDAARPLSRRVRTISDSIGLDKRGADRRDVLHAMRSSCRCRGVASSEFCVVWHQAPRSTRRHPLLSFAASCGSIRRNRQAVGQ